jgi:hypothetical protein
MIAQCMEEFEEMDCIEHQAIVKFYQWLGKLVIEMLQILWWWTNNISMAVFWVVAMCSLVEVYQHFRGALCLHHQGDLSSDNMVLQPRRQPSSYLLPWEPQILQMISHSKVSWVTEVQECLWLIGSWSIEQPLMTDNNPDFLWKIFTFDGI